MLRLLNQLLPRVASSLTKPGAELAAAVPALAALCRSFTAFGTRRMIPEQTAAIEALAIIGGREAAHAVLEMIERAAVQGLGLQLAVSAAARLGSVLSQDALCQLLRHAEPRIRADACRCARPLPELILLLIDLLDDLDQGVATSAACALGRMGRIEARGRLESLLRDDPSEDVIDATSPIADEECAVLLGRIARSGSVLADAALASLENIDHARAVIIAAAIRRLRSSAQIPGHDEGVLNSRPMRSMVSVSSVRTERIAAGLVSTLTSRITLPALSTMPRWSLLLRRPIRHNVAWLRFSSDA